MPLQTALINIINGKRHQSFGNCCLCLKTVESSSLSIHDEIIVTGSLVPQSLLEILVFILGDEVTNVLLNEDLICDLCKIMAVKCYTYIKMCKETMSHLCNAVSTLADSLIEYNTEDLTGYKSLFITLNTSDYSCTLYTDRMRSSDYRSRLLKRLYSLIDRKPKFDYEDNVGTSPAHSEIDKKTENKANLLRNNIIKDIKNDSSQKTTKKIVKYTVPNILKRRAKSTVTILTKDMMYGKDDIRCRICSQTFSVPKNLRQHYLRLHAPKDFKCLQCPKCYGSKQLLEEHMLLSHTPTVCSICGKSYNKRSSLKQHEAGHNIKLICSKCGKCYKTPATLRAHICQKNKDNSEKKYACDYCDKKFVRKSTIRTHIKFEHGDGKACECRWCNKKFAALSTLNLHIVTHTQEKNFGCEICGGKFVSKASLVYHTRTHTGEKPFECNVCNKRFLSVSRRTEHVRRVHSSQTLECMECHVKFKSRSGLLRHRRNKLH